MHVCRKTSHPVLVLSFIVFKQETATLISSHPTLSKNNDREPDQEQRVNKVMRTDRDTVNAEFQETPLAAARRAGRQRC